MKRIKSLAVLLAIATVAGLGIWYYHHSIASDDPEVKSLNVDECPYPGTLPLLLASKDKQHMAEMAKLTGEVGNYVAQATSNNDVPRVNLIDNYIFDAMERATPPVPHAPLSSDAEFLRRVYLDLTGRPPSVQKARAFLASTDPRKRDALIEDIIFGEQWEQFVEKMTLFFGDLLRNRQNINGENRNAYYWYIRGFLEEGRPYDQVARELIASNGDFNSLSKGYLNFLMRGRETGTNVLVDHLDSLAIQTSRVFLGVSAECISCHNGARHLEEINLWLKDKTRRELWGMSAFFSGLGGRNFQIPTGTAPAYLEDCGPNAPGGLAPICENMVTPGYDTQSPGQQNGVRPPRTNPDRYLQPAYLLTGEAPQDGGLYREELVRIITSDRQFAKALVNYLWKEFMGVGIVDPPYAFDLARQDPKNPPAEPWTIQPSNPELLDALAQAFINANYDLREIVEMIVKSSAYQLSAYFNGTWDERYASYFARHFVRRLSAEQLHDSVVKATGVPGNYKVNLLGAGFDPITVNYAVQLPDPSEPNTGVQQDRNMAAAAVNFLNVFERGDRFQNTRPDPARGSMFQVVQLVNGIVPPVSGQPFNPAANFLAPRLRATSGGTVQRVLETSGLTNEQIVDELFLSALSRYPTAAEKSRSMQAMGADRVRGAEDLMWALVNKLDFILY
jgi:hypothetical protein